MGSQDGLAHLAMAYVDGRYRPGSRSRLSIYSFSILMAGEKSTRCRFLQKTIFYLISVKYQLKLLLKPS